MKNILILLALCTFVCACNTSNKTTLDTTPPKDNTISIPDKSEDAISDLDDDPVFYLHRESCRGYCPGYTFTIFESGKVDYFGQRNVDRLGNHIAEMDKTTLIELKKVANEIDLKNMDEEYVDKNIMDVPRWTLKFEGKSIKFMEYKAPEELKGICQKIDETLEKLTWEKID